MDIDLYKELGLSKGASDDEIRQAYRRLAKENHPDLHPGDTGAEDKFKKISAAFSILGDPDKRKRYDAGEIDASGQERPQHSFYRDFGAGEAGGAHYRTQTGFEDFGDIFGDIFGHAGRRGRAAHEFHMRGMDYRYHLEIDFMEAALGAKKRVLLPEGETLDITVPAGVEDGQVLRLRGKGGPGVGKGSPGDAHIDLTIRPHPVFTREGLDILLDLPISLDEAVLGGKVNVPTIHGRVALTIPKGTSGGKIFRLRGKGIKSARTGKSGDQRVKVRIVMPERIDQELETFMQKWRTGHEYDPRRKLKEAL